MMLFMGGDDVDDDARSDGLGSSPGSSSAAGEARHQGEPRGDPGSVASPRARSPPEDYRARREMLVNKNTESDGAHKDQGADLATGAEEGRR